MDWGWLGFLLHAQSSNCIGTVMSKDWWLLGPRHTTNTTWKHSAGTCSIVAAIGVALSNCEQWGRNAPSTPPPPPEVTRDAHVVHKSPRRGLLDQAQARAPCVPSFWGLFAEHTPRYGIVCLTPCKIIIFGGSKVLCIEGWEPWSAKFKVRPGGMCKQESNQGTPNSDPALYPLDRTATLTCM